MRPEYVEFLKALDETQHLTPDRMRAYQCRLLDVLLRHARRETSFYADRLAPVFRPADTIDWERWEEIPILTRSEAQENSDKLTARNLPPVAGKAIESTTSGSTGRPFRHYTTAQQNIASICANERFFAWHDLDPAALLANIRVTSSANAVYPAGHSRLGWRRMFPTSPAIELSIATPVDQQIEWLARVKPKYLTSYPSNLREIAKRLSELGTSMTFDAILTFGEMTSPDAREAIRHTFGVDPLDRYGSTEMGHMAATCPHSGKLHLVSELVKVEIVNDDGTPTEPGAQGRILATSFYNLATPLIRYDTGDYGILAAEPCGCGRTLPLFERILGRGRNIFKFEDGSRVWPVLLSREVQPYVPHRQYQVVQVAENRIEYRYVPVSPDQSIDLPGLTALARERLHPSLTVTPVAVAEIERSPSGKFEDYVSLVA